jgi:hypothetical protein
MRIWEVDGKQADALRSCSMTVSVAPCKLGRYALMLGQQRVQRDTAQRWVRRMLNAMGVREGEEDQAMAGFGKAKKTSSRWRVMRRLEGPGSEGRKVPSFPKA